MLLSYSVLTLNRTMNAVDISLSQNRYRIEALALLNTHSERAKQCFFDESSLDTTSNKDLSDFVMPDQLGLDPNDAGIIDDFDDYHNLTLTDTGGSGVVYRLNFAVDYVTRQGDVLLSTNTRQYHKRMRISISDAYNDPMLTRVVNGQTVRDTLRIEFVNSYWFYN